MAKGGWKHSVVSHLMRIVVPTATSATTTEVIAPAFVESLARPLTEAGDAASGTPFFGSIVWASRRELWLSM